jgi:Ulp1 family protease
MLLMLPDIYTMAASLGTFIETEWTQESNIGINDDSLQIDGFNCGVFTCLFAAYVTVDIRFNFSGSLDNMSLMRKFIMLDMLNREFTGFT